MLLIILFGIILKAQKLVTKSKSCDENHDKDGGLLKLCTNHLGPKKRITASIFMRSGLLCITRDHENDLANPLSETGPHILTDIQWHMVKAATYVVMLIIDHLDMYWAQSLNSGL